MLTPRVRFLLASWIEANADRIREQRWSKKEACRRVVRELREAHPEAMNGVKVTPNNLTGAAKAAGISWPSRQAEGARRYVRSHEVLRTVGEELVVLLIDLGYGDQAQRVGRALGKLGQHVGRGERDEAGRFLGQGDEDEGGDDDV